MQKHTKKMQGWTVWLICRLYIGDGKFANGWQKKFKKDPFLFRDFKKYSPKPSKKAVCIFKKQIINR